MIYVKKLRLYLLCVVLVFGCNDYKTPEHVIETKKIMKQFCKDMYRSHGYVCQSEGGGFMHNINNIHLGFNTNGVKSREELRFAIVDMVEEFLRRLNSDERIQDHLSEYPFPASNLSFSLSLKDKNGKPFTNKGNEKKYLHGVFLVNGNLFYVFKNEEKTIFQDSYKESYEEALTYVKGKKS